MIVPRRVASTRSILAAFVCGAAVVLAPGCGGSDDPGRFSRTIELPKRDASPPAKGKELAKQKVAAARKH